MSADDAQWVRGTRALGSWLVARGRRTLNKHLTFPLIPLPRAFRLAWNVTCVSLLYANVEKAST